MPNANLVVNKNTVLCELHWPKNFETVKVRNGKLRPKNPPSVWPGVPSSQISTPLAPDRNTKCTLSAVRTLKNDEFSIFLLRDTLSFLKLKDELINKQEKLPPSTFAVALDDVILLQSKHCEPGTGIPKFLIKIFQDLSFETYRYGTKFIVSSLSANRINTVKSWSIFDEILRAVNSLQLNNHQKVVLEQISAMSPRCIGEKSYSPEMVVRAFSYFATSRALYLKLRRYFQLPSVRTLTRITSKVSKLDEKKYLNLVFQQVNPNQKLFIIFHDEIYLKKMLYRGGTIFGQSKDNPAELAKTMLGILIHCLNGGPKILLKMIPVSKLQANFLFQQINDVSECVRAAGVDVKAIICDGNRVNQAFFRMFKTVPDKLWLTIDSVYLLYDFVHL